VHPETGDCIVFHHFFIKAVVFSSLNMNLLWKEGLTQQAVLR